MRSLLTEKELSALISIVEDSQEGPPEIVFEANMAISKLQMPQAADLAACYVESLDSDERIALKEQSKDFFLGAMYEWLLEQRAVEGQVVDVHAVIADARDAHHFIETFL